MSDPTQRRLEALEKENLQLRRAVEELSILNELSVAISSSRTTDDIIQTIIKRSIKAISAEQGVITLVGEDQADPTQTLVRTMSSSGDREAYSPDQNLLGWMYMNRRALIINDPRGDDRFKGVRWSDSVRSVLAVPMVVHSRLIGVLTLYNKKRGKDFSQEDQRLLSILAGQSAQVVETARLYEEEKKLASVNQELGLAFDIQSRLLPASAPVIDGYDIHGMTVPAQSVGGDLFDFIETLDGKVAVCVGDVSGKGMPAALMMSNVQATLRGQALFLDSAKGTIERSNRLLSQSIKRGSFVTIFYAVLSPDDHSVTYVNAGHNKPYIVRADGTLEKLEEGGLVVGFMASQDYQETTRHLEPGDTLFVYSDGVTEAMNAAHDQYDDDRLEALLPTLAGQAATDVVGAVWTDVKKHTAGSPPNDDITMLVVRRT